MLRSGVTFKHPVEGDHGWLQWRVHPYETDGSGWQASVIHSLTLSPTLSLAGFTDLNVLENAPNRWVTESQLSIRLDGTFDLVVEGRYNGIEDANSALDGWGVAFGVRLKL
jgi:hypothetical protein